jgi:hypothetical protein
MRHLPIETLHVLAKQCNSWLRGTKIRFGFLWNTERIQKNLEEFRGNLDVFRHNLDVLGTI